jgi:hypothetical protein
MKVLIIAFLTLAPAAQAATVGVKNFREVAQFFTDTTHVDPNDPVAAAQVASSASRLPKTGVVDEVTSAGLLTFTALAGVYCQELIASDAKLELPKRRAHKKVDFTHGPSALTPDVQQSVIEEYAGLYWMRSPSEVEKSAMLTLFQQATDPSQDTPDQTQLVLLAVCTSAASSLDSLVE